MYEKYAKKYRQYVNKECKKCGSVFKRRKDHKCKNPDLCHSCVHKKRGENSKGKVIQKARKGEYVNCDYCGKKTYKKRSQLKIERERRFCNNKCQSEWNRENKTYYNFITSPDNRGEKNGRYKHGNRVGSHDRHKELKENLTKRDGAGCYICKTDDKIHVHRIEPGGEYSLDNTVMLCNKHHAMVHQDYKKWKPLLINEVIGHGN